MKRTLRKTLRLAVPVLAFLFQLWRGFRPCGPEPGVIMSGYIFLTGCRQKNSGFRV